MRRKRPRRAGRGGRPLCRRKTVPGSKGSRQGRLHPDHRVLPWRAARAQAGTPAPCPRVTVVTPGLLLPPRFDALGRPWRDDLRVLLPGDPSPLRLRLAPLSFHLVPKHPPIRSPPPGRRDVELVSQEPAAVLMVSVRFSRVGSSSGSFLL